MGITAAGLLLAVAVLFALLNLAGVQRLLFDRARATIESRTGLRLAADGVRLKPLGVALELTRPSVAVGAAEPFLTAEGLSVRLAPGSLVRGPLTLRELVLVAPRLDGSRPLPGPAEGTQAGGGAPALAIERLQLQDGAAVGFAPPAPLGKYLEGASLDGLWLEGELVDGRLRLGWEGARLRLEPVWRPAFEVALEGSLAGPLDGPLELERLLLDGEVVRGSVTGRLGTAAEQPLAIDFDLAADLPSLLGSDAGPGPLRIGGSLDLRAPRGGLRLAADGLPAELARPWLDAELFDRAALGGSRLDLAAELALDGERVDGLAEARWARGGRLIAETRAEVAGELSAAELPVDLRLSLLPGSAGRRLVVARLLVPRERPAEGRIDDGRLELRLADLERELETLRGLWPAWVPELPAGLAAGPLRVDGRLAGSLRDPTVRLAGDWAPAPGAAVRLTARARPAAGTADGRLTVDALPLGRFVEGARGSLAATASAASSAGSVSGRLSLAGEGLGHGEVEVDELRLSASLAGRRVLVEELSARQADRRLDASGEVALEDTPSADLEVELSGDWGPLSTVAGSLRLAGGRLLLDLPRAELAGVTASLEATLPLATLAELPGAEALAELPLGGTGGPLELAWRQPAADWAAALGVGAPEGEPAPGWTIGSAGWLRLEPSSPATASGEIEIAIPVVGQAGHTLSAAAPLALSLAAGRLTLAPARVELDGRPVDLRGEALLRPDWTPRRAPEELLEEAGLVVRAPFRPPLEEVELALRLRGGGLEIATQVLMTGGDRGRLDMTAPLAALTAGEGGRIALGWDLPAADWSGWLGDAEAEERKVERLVAGIAGSLEVDLERPALATGELRIPSFEADLGDQLVRAREPIELRLGDGRLTIASARLVATGAPLELSGWIDLEPAWRPGMPAGELLREVAVSGGGVLPAALLNPFLEGGAGEGTLLAEIDVRGPRETARGEIRLDGASAGLYFVSPYALEVAAPEVTVRVEDGAARFEGSARLNEGGLRFSGEAAPGAGVSVKARLEQVRAVLDYGLLTLLDGDLRLDLAPDGSGRLTGTVTVDRGQLTRPIRLEGLLLGQPADLLGSELDPLEAIVLDVKVETRQGVRVKNNLADLKVRWEPIAVRGNPVEPILEGRLEVDPGGLIYAYGQTVRLDSAAVVYRGLPRETPTLELQTTSSLEDPSIGRLEGSGAFAERRLGAPREEERRGGGDALTTGLATFVGEQLTGSVGEALGGASISFRPLLIFGEADPGARLTASTDVSAQATLAASIDLRNAERQTYLLDLHDEQAAARLSAQLFTNDVGNEGGTLQQRLDLGGTRIRAAGPRLRGLEIDRVPGVRRRALKRVVGYRKGERLAEGAQFEIAVAVGELLRERGYPDARVRVVEGPSPRRSGITLAVRIDSGPRVEFLFTGEALPKPLRRAVAQLYRGDFYEPVALDEMRAEAVRAWRSRGHLDPRVEIQRELLPGGPPERRRVIVDSQPGERVDPPPPRFSGLPPAESTELASLFASTLRRAELAAGLEAADRRALRGLAALGFPDAVITGRRLSEDGRLTVAVEPGERLRLAVLEFHDAGGLRTEVSRAGGLEAGDPVRSDLLGRAALEVEGELRDAGYLDAEVTLRVEPLGPERPAERKAIFAIDRGPLYRLAATEFDGLGATRPGWARRTAGLVEGEPLAPSELRAARRRLYETGLFSSVSSDARIGEEDGARVLFEVVERPRFRLAYGLRWESEEGTGVVVDALDRNFLGRGVDVGIRALWSEEFQQVRLSGAVPGVLGPRSRLDLFLLIGEEEKLFEEGTVLDETRNVEATVQLGWQLGRRTTGRVYGRWEDRKFTETFLEEDPFFGPLDPIEVRVRQPFLGLQYIFDARDSPVAPRRGLFASVDLSYSDENLGGDIRYGRLFGQVNTFRPAGRLAGRRLTWAQSARLGHAKAFGGQELLGDLLLRAGGEYSVRGYLRESLGPPALSGILLPSVEDNSLLVVNQELRFELWNLLSGVLFFDAGNVWIDNDIDLDLFTSTGVGLRAETPFGLLRLDVAWPLDRRDEIDPAVKVYFGLGNAF